MPLTKKISQSAVKFKASEQNILYCKQKIFVQKINLSVEEGAEQCME